MRFPRLYSLALWGCLLPPIALLESPFCNSRSAIAQSQNAERLPLVEHRIDNQDANQPVEGAYPSYSVREQQSSSQLGATRPSRLDQSSQNSPPNSDQMDDRMRHLLPLDSMGSMLEVRAQSESLQSLAIFDRDRDKESFSFSYRRALVRSPQSNFTLSWGFSYLDESLSLPPPARGAFAPPPPPSNLPPAGRNTPSDAGLPSPEPLSRQQQPSLPAAKMRTGVLQFAQNYRHRDRDGQWLVRSQFNLGTELASSPAPMNADAQFFSWLGRVERTQRISRSNQVSLQVETQLSPSSLLPPHQFKMKDRRFEAFDRDARPTEISGNNGVRLRLENRMALLQKKSDSLSRNARAGNAREPLVTLVPFVDLGYAWGQGNSLRPSEQFLGRAGLGLLLQPLPNVDIQFDYLTYWGDLGAAENTQDVYVTFGYRAAW